jgi:hypothetical protein
LEGEEEGVGLGAVDGAEEDTFDDALNVLSEREEGGLLLTDFLS